MKFTVLLAFVATTTTAMKLNPDDVKTVQVKLTENMKSAENLKADVDLDADEFNMIWKKLDKDQRMIIKRKLRAALDNLLYQGENLNLDDLWYLIANIFEHVSGKGMP